MSWHVLRKVCSMVFFALMLLLIYGEATSQIDTLKNVPGKLISDEEGRKIEGHLASKVYLPGRELKSLRCEFAPSFSEIDMEKVTGYPSLKGVKSVLFDTIPGKVPFIFYLGDVIAPLFYDENLLKAQKAVFIWERVEENTSPQRYSATVLLYDNENCRIDTHLFIGPFLGDICTKLLLLHVTDPFDAYNYTVVSLSPYPEKRTSWRSDENALYKVREFGKEEYPVKVTGIHFDRTHTTPTSVGLKLWQERRNRWQKYPNLCTFSALPGSGKLGVVQSGLPQYETWYTWVNEDGCILVKKARGSHIDLEAPRKSSVVKPSMMQKKDWEVTIEQFEINPDIAQDMLQWPEGRKVEMDFSTPDDTIGTIFECLRTGRKYLLAYCTTAPPETPISWKAPVSHLAYLFDTFPHMRKELEVMEKRQEGENWIYTIRIPKMYENSQRKFDVTLVPFDGLWKMKEAPEALVFSFYD